MAWYNFWKRLKTDKLEDLIKEVESLKKDYEQGKKEAEEEKQEWRRKAQEAESLMKEEESKKKVRIHFSPGKDLFVVIDGKEILYANSEDVNEENFKKLIELREAKDVLGIKRMLNPDLPPTPTEIVEKEIAEADTNKVESQILETLGQVAILVNNGDFEIQGNSVVMKGIKRSIPRNLIQRLSELAGREDEDAKLHYEGLKNFWRWIVLNPNPRATEEFYALMEKYRVPITKEGFVLAYRWVRSVGKPADNIKLINFISNSWTKVKKAKKGLNNFDIYENLDSKEYFLVARGLGKKVNTEEHPNHNFIGMVGEMYDKINELQTKQSYTDGHTGTMDIRIGKEVSMPRRACDESSASCSRGLHAAFNINDHSGNGDTKIIIAICPRDIVSVPYRESKFRCCKYLPLAVLNREEDDSNFVVNDEGLHLMEDYFKGKIEELVQDAENLTVKELTEQRIIPANLGKEEEAEEIVVNIMDQLKEQLNDRIVAIQ
jgi:hypothetical protein